MGFMFEATYLTALTGPRKSWNFVAYLTTDDVGGDMQS